MIAFLLQNKRGLLVIPPSTLNNILLFRVTARSYIHDSWDNFEIDKLPKMHVGI